MFLVLSVFGSFHFCLRDIFPIMDINFNLWNNRMNVFERETNVIENNKEKETNVVKNNKDYPMSNI